MINEIEAARNAALAEIAALGDVEAVSTATARLTGKKSALSGLKKGLGALESIDDKKAAGQAINAALAAVNTALDDRRAELNAAALADRVEHERLDLTEFVAAPTRGHAHLVTQAWERLEDLFIGLGFQIAEGPEVETDWHNFEALNMGEGHPARGEFDTLFLDYAPPGGQPGSTLLRTHTSPVQIRTMLAGKPPIYIVAPGRVFRRDTADATHMPVFHLRCLPDHTQVASTTRGSGYPRCPWPP